VPKSPAERKVARCTVCGHNATRGTVVEGIGTYPLCRRCDLGGAELHGAEQGYHVHRLATMNGILPLEQRMHVGDSHTRKDGTVSQPKFNDRRN